MKTITILVRIRLAGQGAPRENERGYAMAALLVAMSIMAVMMTVVMPVWNQAARREKEEELIFRGNQYARAIGLFQKKFANAYPPNIEVLVDQKFLRKKFKDPITNDDFAPLAAGQAPGVAGQPAQSGAQPSGRGQSTPGTVGQQQPSQTQPGNPLRGVSPIGTPGAGGGTTAGISGVTSKSKAQSIRLYNGRNHYNEWAFVYVPQVQAPGAGAPGSTVPGLPGVGVPGSRGGSRGSNPRGGTQNPRQGGPGGFDPNNPGRGGRGFGPGQVPIQPPGPRGRL
jgi:type II secretory pathway pseudopilin PulG